MRAVVAILALLPLAVFSQEDLWEDDWDDAWEQESGGASRWTGFAEAAFGRRLQSDPLLDAQNTLEELRARVEASWQPGDVSIALKADAWLDGITDDVEGDIRDLSLGFRVGSSTDVAVGRQVQTWGTGDLLFLNDLFPKDFVSFFAGRDDEYLKAPGTAVRVTRYGTVNVDFVWTPVFEPDVYLTGERFSFFWPPAGQNIAPRPPLSAVEPSRTLNNGEFALRLFKTVESREYAVYAYRGFFKQPNAFTADLDATFAPLTALGASLRQPLGPGLFNAEFAYYASRDDRSGSDPFVPNDQLRVLGGYEWEARRNFTVGLQYYLEWTMDHDELIANSPFPQFEPEEFRQLLTARLTYRLQRDRHTFSLFAFASPSDRDFCLRPAYTWRYSDRWSLTAGGNLFGGEDRFTFFNQLQDASNLYLRLRFNY